MIRQLCCEHHITEFNALPNSRRHEASTWVTVAEEDCAECKRLAELQPAIDAQRIEELEAEVAQAQEENRVRGECLELAMETLELYTEGSTDGIPAQGTLVEIEARLAQLEPEEQPAPDALPCGHPRSAATGGVTSGARCARRKRDDRT